MRSGISELTIIDFGVRVKNDRKIAEWVIGLSRNQRSYNPEMGGRNAPKYARDRVFEEYLRVRYAFDSRSEDKNKIDQL